jgi:peptide/nickel transport system permease protein
VTPAVLDEPAASLTTVSPSLTAASSSGSFGWTCRRIVMGVFVLFTVSVLVFVATRALPSDPAQAILGRQATPELLAQLRETLGLDRPLIAQYTSWLSGLLQGDLGTSLASRQPVSGVIGPALVNTLALLCYAAAMMIPTSIALGVALAVTRRGWLDRSVNTTLLGLMTLPDFVVGMVLLLVFATTLLPVLPAVSLIPPGESGFGHPAEMILPALTAALIASPFLVRQTRASMVETLGSTYVTQATLRGVPLRRVIWRHALPNSLVPMVQGSALMLGYLLGGVVVIEYIFNYPGLGTVLINAVSYRDLPVLQAVTLIFAAGVVVFNLAADVLTVILSPKLRTSGGAR